VRVRPLALAATCVAAAALALAGPAAAQDGTRTVRQAFFVGIDTSGSFQRANYDDGLAFLAHYLYGHLNGLGGLARPRELFVAGIGGNETDQAKSFHPIHDFASKDVEQIEADLKRWFPPRDTLTDFNTFFRQVARIVKERGLMLAPISLVIVSDGVPDVPGIKADSPLAYGKIDLGPLEYLSRNLTVRLVYPSAPVGEKWRRLVPRQRVRLWTVDNEVMKGWRAHLNPDVALSRQARLWKWVIENVDYRVRRGI
jgi:hypothetical protein